MKKFKKWSNEDKYAALILMVGLFVTLYGVQGLTDITNNLMDWAGVPFASIQPSSLTVLSADFQEYTSNHPQFNNGFMNIFAKVGTGAESIDAYISQDELADPSSNTQVRKSLRVTANTVKHNCRYEMSQRAFNPEIFTYSVAEILCPDSFGCWEGRMVELCNQYAGTSSIVVRNILNERKYFDWGKSLCVFKTPVANQGVIEKLQPELEIRIGFDNGDGIIYGNLKNTDPQTLTQQSVDIGNNRVQLVGISSLGLSCPEPIGQDVTTLVRDNHWTLAELSAVDYWNSQIPIAENKLWQVSEGQSFSTSQILTLLAPVNNAQARMFESKPFIFQTQQATISGSSAIIDLTSLPQSILFADIQILLDADYIQVYHPVADLKLDGKLSTQDFSTCAGEFGTINIGVVNTGEVSGAGAITVTCSNGFTANGFQLSPIPAGQTVHPTVTVRSGTVGTGMCTVCVTDEISQPDCQQIGVGSFTCTACTNGLERCLDKQPQRCVNNGWVNVGQECTLQETCGFTTSGIGCEKESSTTCNSLCISNGYESGKCESVAGALIDVPFIDGEKNIGYAAGNCGLLLPPENCLCTVQQTFPFFLGALIFILTFSLGYLYMYPKDYMQSLILAALPMLLLLIAPRVGLDVFSIESSLKSAIAVSLPQPYEPSTTQVVIVMAIVGGLVGLATSLANIIVGDEPFLVGAGVIVGAVVGYAVKGILATLQAPLAILVGILSISTLRSIIEAKMTLPKQTENILLITLATIITILAYLIFWHAIIILSIGLVLKAVVMKTTSIKQIITKK